MARSRAEITEILENQQADRSKLETQLQVTFQREVTYLEKRNSLFWLGVYKFIWKDNVGIGGVFIRGQVGMVINIHSCREPTNVLRSSPMCAVSASVQRRELVVNSTTFLTSHAVFVSLFRIVGL